VDDMVIVGNLYDDLQSSLNWLKEYSPKVIRSKCG